jgi:hypothetical protein
MHITKIVLKSVLTVVTVYAVLGFVEGVVEELTK